MPGNKSVNKRSARPPDVLLVANQGIRDERPPASLSPAFDTKAPERPEQHGTNARSSRSVPQAGFRGDVRLAETKVLPDMYSGPN